MVTNACFSDESYTMSLDIETNQWYGVEGLLNVDVNALPVAGAYQGNMHTFVCNAISLAKTKKTVKVHGKKCMSLDVLKEVCKETEEYMHIEENNRPLCEMMFMNYLFSDSCMMDIVGTEVNVVGAVLIKSSTWVDCNTIELIEKMKTFDYKTKIPVSGLESGYYALDEDGFERLLTRFYNFHKQDGSIGLIVAHNVNYEWNQLLRHSKTLMSWVRKGLFTSKPMGGNARNTIKALDVMNRKMSDKDKKFDDRATVISFRDSYLFCTMSLRSAGDKFGYKKGDLDYLRSFDLKKVSRAGDNLARQCRILRNEGFEKVEPFLKCKTDEEKLLQYNRRDCEIPILILHESFVHPEIILNPEVRADGKTGKPYVPVSSNNINDILNRERGKRRYEVVVKKKNGEELWKNDRGEEVPPGTNFAHRVLKYETLDVPPVKFNKDGKPYKQKSIYEEFAFLNGYKFGYNSEPRTIVEDGEVLQIHYTEEDHNAIRETAGGGFVGVNYAYTYTVIKQVGDSVKVWDRDGTFLTEFKNCCILHEDLSSAHPSQVNKRLFPATAPQRADDAEIQTILLELKQRQWKSKVNHPKSPFDLLFVHRKNKKKYSGFGTFTLENVRCKPFTKRGLNYVACMPLTDIKPKISGDVDCETWAKNLAQVGRESEKFKNLTEDELPYLVIRNKILAKKEPCIVTCTFEQLCIYQMFYDFEIADAKDVYTYQMGVCPAYIWDIFDYAGERKVDYKEVKTAIEELTVPEVLAKLDKYKDLFDESDYLYLKSHPDDERYAENALTRIKGIFNGIYGLMYQTPIHRQIEIGINQYGLTETSSRNTFEAKTKRNYLIGMYIAQWSRVDLALHLRHAIDHKCQVLYWATDSIYMIAPNDYDGRGLFNEQKQTLKDQRPNHNKLGGMDYEQFDKTTQKSLIRGFCMTQCLRNLIWYENKYGVMKCKTTFSGANVEALFPINEDKHTPDDFDACCERMLSENLCISPFDNNKNAKKIAENGSYNLLPQGIMLNDLSNEDYKLAKLASDFLKRGMSLTVD